jgi:hypothetical protein
MIQSFNYNNMKKKELIERCKKLEELLMIKNIDIAKELVEEPSDTKTQYGIDAYFNKENEEEVCISLKFKE